MRKNLTNTNTKIKTELVNITTNQEFKKILQEIQESLNNFATKKDLERFATKKDLDNLTFLIKEEIKEIKKEINRLEERIDEMYNLLKQKFNVLSA